MTHKLSRDKHARLWRPGFIRIFLSHVSTYKKEAQRLKVALQLYGASCFVAHSDIKPSREWQKEIERALESMDVMVPLLTDGFEKSYWTDQEIGYALGKGVFILPIRFDLDPYGFIAKYQALPGKGKSSATLGEEMAKTFLGNKKTKDRALEGLVSSFEEAESFNHANTLMHWLDEIESAPIAIAKRLKAAPKNNSQVAEAYTVQNRLPGLLRRLSKARRSAAT